MGGNYMKRNQKELIERYQYRLLRRSHVKGVGYGFKEKRGKKTKDKVIIVFVDKKLPENKLNNFDIIPQRIEKFNTDVIEIGEINFFSEDRTARLRPVQPGISIGHYKISAGTLGAIVRDKKTGESMLLSNNHVLANISSGYDERAKKGDPILQPGSYDDGKNPEDIIARLERFTPIRRTNEETTCPVALSFERLSNILIKILKPDYMLKLYKKDRDNIVDAAIARPVDGINIDREIIGIGKPKGIRDPKIGMYVKKSGRTTAVSHSEITAINSTIEVKLSQSESAIFKDQFVSSSFSKPGDSGSLVLDEENNAIGLLFAGSDKATVCNVITNVFKALDVEL